MDIVLEELEECLPEKESIEESILFTLIYIYKLNKKLTSIRKSII